MAPGRVGSSDLPWSSTRLGAMTGAVGGSRPDVSRDKGVFSPKKESKAQS